MTWTAQLIRNVNSENLLPKMILPGDECSTNSVMIIDAPLTTLPNVIYHILSCLFFPKYIINNMLPWKRNLIRKVRRNKPRQPLVFIHTPKCGGSYVATVLRSHNIRCKGHNPATRMDGITFTVIRDPVKRFESLLNYRLSKKNPRKDWPRRLTKDHYRTKVTLNRIISKMRNNELLNFIPFATLSYWTKGVDVCLVIDELPEFLEIFGYSVPDLPPSNVSPKIRGTINRHNQRRLRTAFRRDMIVYRSWTR